MLKQSRFIILLAIIAIIIALVTVALFKQQRASLPFPSFYKHSKTTVMTPETPRPHQQEVPKHNKKRPSDRNTTVRKTPNAATPQTNISQIQIDRDGKAPPRITAYYNGKKLSPAEAQKLYLKVQREQKSFDKQWNVQWRTFRENQQQFWQMQDRLWQ